MAGTLPESCSQAVRTTAPWGWPRFLLQRYGPPSVVVDENLKSVQFRGQTGHSLEAASGEPNLSILKMAHEGLLVPPEKCVAERPAETPGGEAGDGRCSS
jgi:hypothetical protein